MTERDASSVQPHMKCHHLHTNGSVMWTFHKEDCKPGDYVLWQGPMQVAKHSCCVYLTPFFVVIFLYEAQNYVGCDSHPV